MKRSSLGLWLLCVVIACSFGSNRSEPIGSGSSALAGPCGTPVSVSAPSTSQAGWTDIGTQTNFIIPATVAVSYAYSIPWLTTMTAKIYFGTGMYCTYSRTASGTPSDDDPLPFTSCSATGYTAGSPVNGVSGCKDGTSTNCISLEASLSGSGQLGVNVSVSANMDPGNMPCKTYKCVNNAVVPQNVALGTVVDNGSFCNGITTCDGNGNTVTGTAPPSTITSGCQTLTCVSGQGYVVLSGGDTCNSTPANAPTSYAGGGSVPSDVGLGMQFIYSGTGASQTGVYATMVTQHLATIRGHVVIRDTSANLPNVVVSILNHPEFGQTLTRTDGNFDIVVNGGQTYTVQLVANDSTNFATTKYVTVQRRATTRWLDWTPLGDIAMVAYDCATNDGGTPCTPVTLGSGSWQSVHGSMKTDADGSRTAVLLVPPGTTINGWGGSNTVHMHATEFTVGNVPSALPGELPPQSAYTYALEAGIVEAADTTETFNQPVFLYLENFTGVPLDSSNATNMIPTGSYDRTRGVWQTEQNGKVYCILNTTGGTAQMSIDNCSTEVNYSGETPPITTGERQELASVYGTVTNKQVWRVPLPHFSGWDCNWTSGPPVGATPPPSVPPVILAAADDPDCLHRSTIECQNQVLGEELPLYGTPYTLHYRSETQHGYHPTIVVPYTGGPTTVPPTGSPNNAEVEIDIAGQRHVMEIPSSYLSTANQSIAWSWDRNDAYGRPVQGFVQAQVRVSYVYTATPARLTPTFASFGGAITQTGNRSDRTITLSRTYQLNVDGFDAQPLGFGGWTISAENVLEPQTGTIWLGTGRKRTASALANVVTEQFQDAQTGGGVVNAIATTGDGTVFAVDTVLNGIISYPGSVVTSLNGSNQTLPAPPTTVALDTIYTVGQAISSTLDGGLFVSTGTAGYSTTCGLLKVTYPALTALTIAGKTNAVCQSNNNFTASGVVAAGPSGALLNPIVAVAVAPDGTPVFAESSGSYSLLRRVKNDGTLETVAGNGSTTMVDILTNLPSCAGTACLAVNWPFGHINGVTVGPDGTVYFSEWASFMSSSRAVVFSVTTDGALHVVAGTNTQGGDCAAAGDGGPATSAQLDLPQGLLWNGGSLYIADVNQRSVRRVDAAGLISTVVGTHCSGDYLNGGLATANPAGYARSVTASPAGPLLFATNYPGAGNSKAAITSVSTPLETPTNNATLVPISDGTVLQFDATPDTSTSATAGQQQFALSTHTGATLATLSYSNGVLSQIVEKVDGSGGNTTTFTQSGSPCTYGPTSSTCVIVQAPHGQTTYLGLTAGYLTSVYTPAGETTALGYSSANPGLLTSLVEPLGGTHTFTYNGSGMLTNDKTPPASGGVALTRASPGNGWTTSLITEMSRSKTYSIDRTPNSSNATQTEVRTTTDSENYITTDTRFSDGSKQIHQPDGTTTTYTYGLDPRFGSDALYLSSLKVSTGSSAHSGVNAMTETTTRTASGCGTSPFSCSSITDSTCGSFNSNCSSGHNPRTTVWSSAGTVTVTSPVGRAVKYTLDGQERVTQISPLGTDPVTIDAISLGYGSSGTYGAGELETITQGSRTTTVAFANADGFPSSITTPINTSTPTVSFGDNYDHDGRVTSETLIGSRIVGFGYDANGNLTSLIEPNGSSYKHNFTPNTLNLLGTYNPPSIGTYADTTYDYDLDGLIADFQPPTGTTVTYTRDSLGREATVSYNHPYSGSVVVTNTYDAYNGTSPGHLTSVTATNGSCWGSSCVTGPLVTTTRTYDGMLLKSETTALGSPYSFSHTVNWSTYDSALRLKTRDIDSNASVTFSYDDDSLVSSVAVVGGHTYSVTRSADTGLLKCTSFDSVSCESYSYDSYGAVSDYKVGGCSGGCESGTPHFEMCSGTTGCSSGLTGSRDAAGRISTRSESFDGATACVKTYTYDTSSAHPTYSFLTSRAGSGGCSWINDNYSYDADGNDTTWTSDNQDRPTDSGNWTYTADGQLYNQSSSSDSTYFLYDPFSNLRRYDDTHSNTLLEYAIDSKNRRVFRDSFGTANGPDSRGWIYEGDRIIGEVNSAGALQSHFVYVTKPNVPDLVLRLESSTWVPYRIVSDNVGTVREVICLGATCACNGSWSAGHVAEGSSVYNYNDEFGAIWNNPTCQPFGFAGGLVDYWASDITRFGHRDYSGWSRHWFSKDPIRFGGGLNLYAYCNNDPVNCQDPLGLAGEFGSGVGSFIEREVPFDIPFSGGGGDMGGGGSSASTAPCPPYSPLAPQGFCTDPCDMSEGKAACYECCKFMNTSTCRQNCCKSDPFK